MIVFFYYPGQNIFFEKEMLKKFYPICLNKDLNFKYILGKFCLLFLDLIPDNNLIIYPFLSYHFGPLGMVAMNFQI